MLLNLWLWLGIMKAVLDVVPVLTELDAGVFPFVVVPPLIFVLEFVFELGLGVGIT